MSEDIWTNTIDEWARAQNAEFIRLEDVMVAALGFDPRNVQVNAEKRAGRVLRQLGYVKTSRRIDGRVTKVWMLDPVG